MHRIVDNAAENRKGWNSLQHDQNVSVTLPNGGEWLLRRVLDNQWLREEFFPADSSLENPECSQKVV